MPGCWDNPRVDVRWCSDPHHFLPRHRDHRSYRDVRTGETIWDSREPETSCTDAKALTCRSAAGGPRGREGSCLPSGAREAAASACLLEENNSVLKSF